MSLGTTYIIEETNKGCEEKIDAKKWRDWIDTTVAIKKVVADRQALLFSLQPKKKSLQIKKGKDKREKPSTIASRGIVPGNNINIKEIRMDTSSSEIYLLVITIFNSERAFRGDFAAEWNTYDS